MYTFCPRPLSTRCVEKIKGTQKIAEADILSKWTGTASVKSAELGKSLRELSHTTPAPETDDNDDDDDDDEDEEEEEDDDDNNSDNN